MKLLIVDDEKYIIEDIVASMDWEGAGIDEVRTAMTVRQAKEILADGSIQLLLCDIEMPQASGLSLLQWIHDEGLACETILITCHAEFRYAKEAVRLGASEYLLKPLDYVELERSLRAAREKIELQRRQRQAEEFEKSHRQQQTAIRERFWMDILDSPGDPEAVSAIARTRGVPLLPESRVLPVLVKIRSWPEAIPARDRKLYEFGIKNIADELFVLETPALSQDAEHARGISLYSAEDTLLLLLTGTGGIPAAGSGEPKTAASCERLIDEGRNFSGCDLCCYIGTEVPLTGLSGEYRALIHSDSNNVSSKNRVFFGSPAGSVTTTVDENWIVQLSLLVNENREEELLRRASLYLQKLAETTGLDRSVLYRFQQDYTQMLYEKAGKRGILPHHLLSDAASIELSRKAPQSVEDTLRWIAHISRRLAASTAELQKTQSVVHTSAAFIKDHLCDDISREDVAAQAFLNADYLDRVFKKETGMSVSKYIQTEKVNFAKYLLSTTDEPVSSIATAVGYANMSNFASMFKRSTGLAPNEYRKRSLSES